MGIQQHCHDLDDLPIYKVTMVAHLCNHNRLRPAQSQHIRRFGCNTLPIRLCRIGQLTSATSSAQGQQIEAANSSR